MGWKSMIWAFLVFSCKIQCKIHMTGAIKRQVKTGVTEIREVYFFFSSFSLSLPSLSLSVFDASFL